MQSSMVKTLSLKVRKAFQSTKPWLHVTLIPPHTAEPRDEDEGGGFDEERRTEHESEDAGENASGWG